MQALSQLSYTPKTLPDFPKLKFGVSACPAIFEPQIIANFSGALCRFESQQHFFSPRQVDHCIK